MKFKILFFSAALLFFTSCATINTSYDYNKTVDFSQFKTFAFYKQGMDSLKLNDLDKNVIISTVTNQLESKGLSQSTDPSLLVNILASSQQVVNVYNNNPYWNSPWTGPWGGPWQNSWGWGYGWGPGWIGQDTTISEDRIGQITIHLIDTRNNTLVWQGVVDGFNVSDAASKEAQIIKAIQQVFTNFPPK
ncbi:DUF4136 domain-containing protein [Apibacter muscae]|uniref:DUF4136 domain-containing protein n=1 Tax=Apibacter muscae TaxID=2509004 RepID=A0A563DEY0_9FLAO|nr:DUF4136 domain-containing protein [Apibacter muscae]TWP24323.1 DUF4136 domain-containing protein [Apibacter muscae]TWP28637.1 DUF4136 domain-containing protein [Apibacter muscae]